jgi:gamma-glutamylcyclotransferase (GGCT)/AIG2-like uncharacterized protein YtfP
MSNLFTYGSLMCSDIMNQVAGCHANFVSATLKDFKRSTIRGEEYPGIVSHPGSEVEGVLYFDLPPKAIERLDSFEGVQYSRQDVLVKTEQLAQYSAMTYVIKPEYCYLLTDNPWNYERFLTIGKSKFLDTYLGFRKI